MRRQQLHMPTDQARCEASHLYRIGRCRIRYIYVVFRCIQICLQYFPCLERCTMLSSSVVRVISCLLLGSLCATGARAASNRKDAVSAFGQAIVANDPTTAAQQLRVIGADSTLLKATTLSATFPELTLSTSALVMCSRTRLLL